MRSLGAGPTVIISPLLALMRNQIEAAERAGIHAATINSTNVEDWAAIRGRVEAGEIDVLLVSPERLEQPDLPRRGAPPADRDRRPARDRRGALHLRLGPRLPTRLPADPPDDLDPPPGRSRCWPPRRPPTRASPPTWPSSWTSRAAPPPRQARTGRPRAPRLARPRVAAPRRAPARATRAPARLARPSTSTSSTAAGIIYTLTVAATQEVAEHLRARGHAVAAYSGQTETTERLAARAGPPRRIASRPSSRPVRSGWGSTPGSASWSTSGHPPPRSPTTSRSDAPAAARTTPKVILLPAHEDRDIWRYFASLAFPPEQQVRTTLRVLAEHGAPMSTAALETHVDLSRTRLETMLKVLDVDGAVDRVRGGWTATGQEWVYDQERYDRVAAARRDEQAAMLQYAAGDGCRMRFLREQLDDPGADDCGRCDNCGGLHAARRGLRDRPRRRGGASAPPGRHPGPAQDVAHGAGQSRHRPEGQDRRGRRGGARRRAAHRPRPRPGAPGAVPSRRRGRSGPPAPGRRGARRARRLARRVARPSHGRGRRRVRSPSTADRRSRRRTRPLPPVAASSVVGGSSTPTCRPDTERPTPPSGSLRSARRFDLDLDQPLDGGPVLLVDDLVATGWTLTLAARALRSAGASAVLPLTLGTET